MKFLDYIFSSFFIFSETMSDGRPGHVGMPVRASIYILMMLSTLNVLSFFTPETAVGKNRIYFSWVIISFCILYFRYYYKKKYLNIVDHFKTKSNKDLYYFITIAYIIASVVAFGLTR